MRYWKQMTMDEVEAFMKGGGRFYCSARGGIYVGWSENYQQFFLATVGSGGNLTGKIGDLQRLMEQYAPFDAWAALEEAEGTGTDGGG